MACAGTSTFSCWMITAASRRRTSAKSSGWRRDFAVRGMVRRIGGDDGLDRLLGVGRAAEGEQAEGAVLLDDRRLARRIICRAKPVERSDERIFGRRPRLKSSTRRRAEIAVLRRCGRRRQDSRRDQRPEPRRRVERFHFFLKSTLRRAGAVNATVTLWRCSPRSGLRNTMSCVPMVLADRRSASRRPFRRNLDVGPWHRVQRHRPLRKFDFDRRDLAALTCTVRTAR